MWRVILTFALLAVFVGCKDDPTKPDEPDATITLVNAPEFLLCELDSFYLYQVRVENLDVDYITCTIVKPNGLGTVTFDLFDDGDMQSRTGPGFASPTSLDAVPNNGTFTRGINALELCQESEGEYHLHFVTVGGSETLETPEVTVDVRSLSECSFGNLTPVMSLPACFDEQTMSITVSPEAGIEIDSVRALWYSGDTLWWSTLFEAGDLDWQLHLAPNLFGCTPSGSNYDLVYEAFTRFGLNCAITVSGNIDFENSLPVVSNPQLADTLYRPVTPGDTDTLIFYVRSDDCELSGWPVTDAVHFEVSRDDTLHWLTIPEYFLRDDGVSPDAVPGDGLASSFLLVPYSTTSLDNIYYLKYYSIECSSGDTSVAIVDSTRIIQPGSALTSTPSDELGISFFK
ncbi:MAG: hypothetical protein KDB65_07190 [Calditrichaeota bacterium]|nr:hypothetical protein [Calditrichota bacterium]MCB9369619.1 hypothetical protein [Calditrichota bacterium]